MKQEMNDILLWAMGLIKKYGVLVFLGLALWLGFKKAWFWIILPIFCLVFLQQLAIIFGITWVSKLSLVGLIISWIFIFSLIKGFASLMVE